MFIHIYYTLFNDMMEESFVCFIYLSNIDHLSTTAVVSSKYTRVWGLTFATFFLFN